MNVPGTTFPLIKPLIGFKKEIEKQLKKFPFEKNVFLMLRFRDTNKLLSDFIIETLKEAGLRGVRADDPAWDITKNVYNPIAVLYCCKYGIALFDEGEPDQAYNPNVIYELAMMQCLTRECLILRHDSLPSVPFDIIKDLYRRYKGELAVRVLIQKWLEGIPPGTAQRRLSADVKKILHKRKKDAQGAYIFTDADRQKLRRYSKVTRVGKPELELATFAAPQSQGNEVIATTENITAADFEWHVASKTEKAWDVSWSLKLINKGDSAMQATIQVLFLDKNGFALVDQVSSRKLPSGEKVVHQGNEPMSPDLAARIQKGIVTISSSP